MKSLSRIKVFSQLILFLLFVLAFSARASTIPSTSIPSMMKVMIEGSELKGERLSSREYKVNDKFFISPTFLNGDFFQVVERLDSLLQKKQLLRSKLAGELRNKIALIRKKRVQLILNKDTGKYRPAMEEEDQENSKSHAWNNNFYSNVLEESNLRGHLEKRLNDFSEGNTVLLEYITVGDGRKMVTNIAVPE